MDGLGLLWSDGTVRRLLLGGGLASSSVACFAGLVYLAQCRRLKGKRPLRRRCALPSLERSERWNRRAITLAFPLLTCGLAPGAGLALITPQGLAVATRGTDPGVLGAAVVWWVSALLLLARYQPALRGRRMMVLTTVAFAALIIGGIGIDPILPSAPGVSRHIVRATGRVQEGRWPLRGTIDAEDSIGIKPTMFQVRLEPARERDRDAGPTARLPRDEEATVGRQRNRNACGSCRRTSQLTSGVATGGCELPEPERPPPSGAAPG